MNMLISTRKQLALAVGSAVIAALPMGALAQGRLAERRWWAEKTGNQNVMARSVMGQRCSAIQVVQR
jgi:hypothetical protein